MLAATCIPLRPLPPAPSWGLCGMRGRRVLEGESPSPDPADPVWSGLAGVSRVALTRPPDRVTAATGIAFTLQGIPSHVC